MSPGPRARPIGLRAAVAARLRPAARSQSRAVPPVRAVPAGTPPHLRRLPYLVAASGEVVHLAGTARARLRGLLGTTELPSGHALLLTRTASIHTLGMRMTLDLIWLDRGGQVLRIDTQVAPGQHRRCGGARAVLETAAGDGERYAALVQAGGVAMMAAH